MEGVARVGRAGQSSEFGGSSKSHAVASRNFHRCRWDISSQHGTLSNLCVGASGLARERLAAWKVWHGMTINSETVHLYDTIFDGFQNHRPEALAESTTVVQRVLREAGITPERLTAMNVLNVGTGREAVVFQRLGAQRVCHFDLSPKAVGALGEWVRELGVSNVTTRVADVCQPGVLGIQEDVDFCYLRGVLHHLAEPDLASTNLIKATRVGGTIHFRVYQGGSFFFFVAMFARSLVESEDFDLAYHVADAHFGDAEAPKGRVAETMDHLFVPVLSLWDISELDAWFAFMGLTPQHRAPGRSYDHSDLTAGSRGVSLLYTKVGSSTTLEDPPPFPSAIDQESGFDYAESWIKDSLKLFDALRLQARAWSQAARVNVAVACMETAFTWDAQGRSALEEGEAHERLQRVLRQSLQDPSRV